VLIRSLSGIPEDAIKPILETEGACRRENLVGHEPVINEVIKNVFKYIDKTATNKTRLAATILPRLARGGKTTILHLLFEELERVGLCPICVSFNGTTRPRFNRLPGESDKEALLRVIGSQFYRGGERNIRFEEKTITQFLEKTKKPIVLLIDELNALSENIDTGLADFLRDEFLDKKDRYLVYTSHIQMNIEHVTTTMGESSRNSNRPSIVAQLPVTYDVKKLRKMHKNCEGITEGIAFYHGGK
jgi:hypothetical protein